MRIADLCFVCISMFGVEDAFAAPELIDAKPRSSKAAVVVETSASELFRLLADHLQWPPLLSDVARVEKRPSEPREWRVVSKLLGHAHVLELTLEKDRLVHFHIVDPGPGGSLVVDIHLEPLGPKTTRVWYTMETKLPLGLDRVVDDDLVRRAREKKIMVDLADIERRFESEARR